MSDSQTYRITVLRSPTINWSRIECNLLQLVTITLRAVEKSKHPSKQFSCVYEVSTILDPSLSCGIARNDDVTNDVANMKGEMEYKRVLGGVEVKKDSWPWQALIR